MPSYDVTDQTILDATPERVFRALVDEYTGVTHWWKQVESRPFGDIPFGQVGAICTVTVRHHGTARFSWRTAEILENHFISFEYLKGDLVGYGDLKLEPVGDQTRIEYRWRVKTRGKANVLGPLLNIRKRHSEVIREGFRALGDELAGGRMPQLQGYRRISVCRHRLLGRRAREPVRESSSYNVSEKEGDLSHASER